MAAFAEGRQLARQGRCDAAIPKFLESLHEERTTGALLNLGDCYERVGKTASALRAFREAGASAKEDDPRHAEAANRVSSLTPHLSTLTVTVTPSPSGAVVVRVDGEPLANDILRVPFPVDPGVHRVAAMAPGGAEHSTTVNVLPGGHHNVALAIGTTGQRPGEPQAERTGLSSAALLLGGAGVLGVAVGAAFGVVAIGDHAELKRLCPAYPECDAANKPRALDLDGGGREAGLVSTLAFTAAGAAFAAGVVVFLTSRRPPVHVDPITAPRGAGVRLVTDF
jgi:hypothetical protein